MDGGRRAIRRERTSTTRGVRQTTRQPRGMRPVACIRAAYGPPTCRERRGDVRNVPRPLDDLRRGEVARAGVEHGERARDPLRRAPASRVARFALVFASCLCARCPRCVVRSACRKPRWRPAACILPRLANKLSALPARCTPTYAKEVYSVASAALPSRAELRANPRKRRRSTPISP